MLGLHRHCTAAQIRTAYRLLAKRHHPDLHSGSPDAVARTQELNSAHEILNDPARRRAYDRELERSEIRDTPAPRARLEKNVSKDVHLRIDEFIGGASREVRVDDPADPNGPQTFVLVIPPGTAPGAPLRLPRGAPFEGGFVLLRLRVLPGFRFKARGPDLRCDLRISARRAAQGGSETLASATGAPLRVEIPAGVGRGEVLRIANEGMPKPRGGRGDLLVRVTYRPEVRISRTSAR